MLVAMAMAIAVVVVVVVDQPAPIGAPPQAVARNTGCPVAYRPEPTMRQTTGLHPGNANADARDPIITTDATHPIGDGLVPADRPAHTYRRRLRHTQERGQTTLALATTVDRLTAAQEELLRIGPTVATDASWTFTLFLNSTATDVLDRTGTATTTSPAKPNPTRSDNKPAPKVLRPTTGGLAGRCGRTAAKSHSGRCAPVNRISSRLQRDGHWPRGHFLLVFRPGICGWCWFAGRSRRRWTRR
ncbi:hypothetical protein ACIQU6_44260 [Streptomyces sp. NPDC090442]|uniref:hypothetical protein n=1 Tax=Streptomyces sp. NPDC090442 TaxID=3365962 RepID=UPI00381D4140